MIIEIRQYVSYINAPTLCVRYLAISERGAARRSLRSVCFHVLDSDGRFTEEETESIRSNRERKRADTFGTVLVHWAGHFQC